MPAAFIVAVKAPPNTIVIEDPYKIYFWENLGNISANDPQMIVIAELSVLCTILPVVNGQDKVQAILDPGCQIITMFEEIYNALAL